MSNTSFLFVEVHHTGKVLPRKDVRTAIQKHVMRDIGAARRGRPRRRVKTKEAQKQSHASMGSSIAPALRLVSGGARTNPFANYPIPMNSDTLFLIDYCESKACLDAQCLRKQSLYRCNNIVYTCPSPRLRPYKDTWLPISLSDPALFYEILSHISQDISAVNSEYSDRGQSLQFHALALRSVNRRLADPLLGTSDGIIGTVLAFACFSVSIK